MAEWEAYLAANVGAAAALLGLLFIGVSINLDRVLGYRGLPERAIETLTMLGVVLLASSLLLVPEQPRWLTGLWVLLAGALAWMATTWAALAGRGVIPPGTGVQFSSRLLLGQLTAAAYLVAGAMLAAGSSDGLYVFAGAITLSYLMAIGGAWVLLVEINR
jgi:modulator of FtsH protease